MIHLLKQAARAVGVGLGLFVALVGLGLLAYFCSEVVQGLPAAAERAAGRTCSAR